METFIKFPKRNFFWVSASIAVLSFVVILLIPSIFHILELKTVDFRFQIRDMLGKTPEISPLVYHLSIDEYSLENSDPYFWSRAILGQIMEKMSEAGTEVIACDFLFAGYRDSLDDKQLIESLRKAGNIVILYQIKMFNEDYNIKSSRKEIKRLIGFNDFAELRDKHPPFPHCFGFGSVPINELLEYSCSSGFANLPSDNDGIIRRYPLAAELDGKIVPSFPLSVLCAFLDYDFHNIELSDRGNLILKSIKLPDASTTEDIIIPLDHRGNMLINYIGGFSEKNYPQSFSAIDLLNLDDVSGLSPQLGGKIGIFSDISSVGKDFGNIPLENNFPNPFIYSNIISNILNQDFLTETGHFTNFPIVIFTSLLIMILCINLKMVLFAISSISLGVVYLLLNIILFTNSGLILPFFIFLIPVGSVFIFSTFYKYLYEEKYLQMMETSLKSYLSPPLLEKVIKNPERLKPGGVRKRISILFSDIAGFTAFCDISEPEEVQEILDEYLHCMVGIVFKNNGIIDKYLGDGLLAFFENEGNEIVSPLNAVNSAVEMQSTAEMLREKWTAQNKFNLHIRVGVTTGYVTVGNIGTKEKIDYTIIGSKVNLASRLQAFGDEEDIIIDKDTRHLIKGSYLSKYLGEVEIKGFPKTAVYKVEYSLPSDETGDSINSKPN